MQKGVLDFQHRHHCNANSQDEWRIGLIQWWVSKSVCMKGAMVISAPTTAPRVIDGPITGGIFQAYVPEVLAPTLGGRHRDPGQARAAARHLPSAAP